MAMSMGPLAGVALLATGRGRGIERFGATREAFLASLAPLVAFPLVGGLLLAVRGHPGAAFVLSLLSVVMLLTPPVVSHAVARRWGREEAWLRYATAANWCQWALLPAGLVLMLVLQVGTGGRLGAEEAAQSLLGLVALYALWLSWVVARHGLGLGWLRAAVLVLIVHAVTAGVVYVPQVLRAAT